MYDTLRVFVADASLIGSTVMGDGEVERGWHAKEAYLNDEKVASFPPRLPSAIGSSVNPVSQIAKFGEFGSHVRQGAGS